MSHAILEAMNALKASIFACLGLAPTQISVAQNLNTLHLPTVYQSAGFEFNEGGQLGFPCLNSYTMARLKIFPKDVFSHIRLGHARSVSDTLYETNVPLLPSKRDPGFKIELWEAPF